jgi:hypothetical protein
MSSICCDIGSERLRGFLQNGDVRKEFVATAQQSSTILKSTNVNLLTNGGCNHDIHYNWKWGGKDKILHNILEL